MGKEPVDVPQRRVQAPENVICDSPLGGTPTILVHQHEHV